MTLLNYFCCKFELRIGATVAAVFSWVCTLVAVVVAVVFLAGAVVVSQTELTEVEEFALKVLQVVGGIYAGTGVITWAISTALTYGIYKESRRLIFIWLNGDILIQTILSITAMFAIVLRYYWFLMVFPAIAWKVYLWIITLSFYEQLRDDEIPVTSYSECEGPNRAVTTISEDVFSI